MFVHVDASERTTRSINCVRDICPSRDRVDLDTPKQSEFGIIIHTSPLSTCLGTSTRYYVDAVEGRNACYKQGHSFASDV